jgi:hypothetical protein
MKPSCMSSDSGKRHPGAAPAVSQVIVDAASHDRHAGTFRVLEQVDQGLLDQCLVSLSA